MLNVVDGGKPDGDPALLIHGFMSSIHQWDLNRDRLGVALRTVLIDLPGHGASPVPASAADAEPETVLAEIERVRERLGIDRWWVIGHSFGGAVAIRYALAHTERTKGVVFTNSRATFGIERTAGEEEAPRPAPADLRKLPFHPIHAKRFPEDLKVRMVEVADRMTPATIDHVGTSSAAWRSRDDLADLTVPVLLVNGVWEKAFQANADAAVELIPDLRRIDLEGGHSINIEQPDAFDTAVLDFIFPMES